MQSTESSLGSRSTPKQNEACGTPDVPSMELRYPKRGVYGGSRRQGTLFSATAPLPRLLPGGWSIDHSNPSSHRSSSRGQASLSSPSSASRSDVRSPPGLGMTGAVAVTRGAFHKASQRRVKEWNERGFGQMRGQTSFQA